MGEHSSADGRLGEVAILGLGLIGGSLGLSLKAGRAATRVVGWARREETRRLALERGAVDVAYESIDEAVHAADIVVLGVPVDVTADVLARLHPVLPPCAVVTDVGSAKARVVEVGEALLAGRFVGGHPMAGSEKSGIEAACADIFPGARWVVTPTDHTEPSALAAVQALAESTGACVRICPPVEHDRFVATLSHLPHILAYGLAQTAADRVPVDWADLAAGSFRDGTRVAGSSPALWTDILLDNQRAVLDSLDAFLEWAGQVKGALQSGDRAAVHDCLMRAHEARQGVVR